MRIHKRTRRGRKQWMTYCVVEVPEGGVAGMCLWKSMYFNQKSRTSKAYLRHAAQAHQS